MKLSMKQLVPTSIDEYVEEHKVGDVVSGRVVEQAATGDCRVGRGHSGDLLGGVSQRSLGREEGAEKADLSALTSMLQARWKRGAGAVTKVEPLRVGQIRSFRIARIEKEGIRVELV